MIYSPNEPAPILCLCVLKQENVANSFNIFPAFGSALRLRISAVKYTPYRNCIRVQYTTAVDEGPPPEVHSDYGL